MNLIIFSKKDLERFIKSCFQKRTLIYLADVVGIILSGMLACYNIDFKKILNVFIENITDPDINEIFMSVMSTWYIISFILFFLALGLLVIYSHRSKKNNADVLTWGQTIVFIFVSILIVQIILPSITAVIAIMICLLYLLIFSSMLLQNIIRHGTNYFLLFIEKICMVFGKKLTYNKFIDSTDYFIFLTLITFLILFPYIFSFLIQMIRKVTQMITKSEAVGLFFKPFEILMHVNVLRYAIYLLLFFISVITYSVSSIGIQDYDNIIPLTKEALLEFVLLDTVIYSIFSYIKDTRKNHKLQKAKWQYIPFKYDLEFVLSAITMHNLKDKNIDVRIKFSVDINDLLKGKKQKDINQIDKLLVDISTNYYEIVTFEQKIKVILNQIINLVG